MHEDFPALRDIKTGQPLIRRTQGGTEELVAEGSPSNTYPIIDGIPRVLPQMSNYADAFGEQWLRWRTTQLDSHSGTSITRDRMMRCLGEECVRMLSREGVMVDVLEVGCGAGRFTEILLDFPASRVTSIDLSSAVEANQQNFAQTERHRVVQADVMHAPFATKSFDVVLCLGVIQHTPDPEATIAKLFELVRPGGLLIIDHYTPEIRRWTKVTAVMLRPIIKRLPSKARMKTCEALVTIFFPLHRAVRHLTPVQMVLSRLSPITTYFHAYPQLPDSLQRDWAVLDTHDGLTDWFKHLRTQDQIAETLRGLGASDIEVWKGGNGVEARCRA